MNDNDNRYRAQHAPPLPMSVIRSIQETTVMKCRKIYVGKDGDGYTIGIVLATSEEVAHAYFVGSGEILHSMECIDPMNDSLGIMGLVTIFKSTKIPGWKIRDSNPETIRVEKL